MACDSGNWLGDRFCDLGAFFHDPSGQSATDVTSAIGNVELDALNGVGHVGVAGASAVGQGIQQGAGAAAQGVGDQLGKTAGSPEGMGGLLIFGIAAYALYKMTN